jgi:hypothetical protein
MSDELPDPSIPQDPGIPGVDYADPSDTPTPDEPAPDVGHTETDDEGQLRPARDD